MHLGVNKCTDYDLKKSIQAIITMHTVYFNEKGTKITQVKVTTERRGETGSKFLK